MQWLNLLTHFNKRTITQITFTSTNARLRSERTLTNNHMLLPLHTLPRWRTLLTCLLLKLPGQCSLYCVPWKVVHLTRNVWLVSLSYSSDSAPWNVPCLETKGNSRVIMHLPAALSLVRICTCSSFLLVHCVYETSGIFKYSNIITLIDRFKFCSFIF